MKHVINKCKSYQVNIRDSINLNQTQSYKQLNLGVLFEYCMNIMGLCDCVNM